MIFHARVESIAEILGKASWAKGAVAEDLFATAVTNAPALHRCYRMQGRTDSLPMVVVPAASDIESFFATIATYYSTQTPISAYLYIVPEDFEQFIDRPDLIIEWGADRFKSSLPLIGASFGEAMLASLRGADAPQMPTYASCRRSLAFVLGRATALYPTIDPHVVVERWERLRRITGLSTSSIASRSVLAIASFASSKKRSEQGASIPADLWGALSDLSSGLDRGDAVREALLSEYPSLAKAILDMSGPFDSRMTVFLEGVNLLQVNSRGSDLDSLAVAYLCNSILPGSFAHSKVLARLAGSFPSSLIWYGFFAASSSDFRIEGFGGGIGLKLLRDLSASFSFSRRPQCDLSLDELEVLLRVNIDSEMLKPCQKRIALISLLPGVDILSRMTPDDNAPPQVGAGVDNFEERLEHAGRLIDEASALLHGVLKREVGKPHVGSAGRRKKK
jgi:hypothetical protein